LLQKEAELLDREQTLIVLKEEVRRSGAALSADAAGRPRGGRFGKWGCCAGAGTPSPPRPLPIPALSPHRPCHASALPALHSPQLELERKLRALLTKDKEKAQEEAALALGLCGTGGTMLP
jgi:hypothetical protein